MHIYQGKRDNVSARYNITPVILVNVVIFSWDYGVVSAYWFQECFKI